MKRKKILKTLLLSAAFTATAFMLLPTHEAYAGKSGTLGAGNNVGSNGAIYDGGWLISIEEISNPFSVFVNEGAVAVKGKDTDDAVKKAFVVRDGSSFKVNKNLKNLQGAQDYAKIIGEGEKFETIEKLVLQKYYNQYYYDIFSPQYYKNARVLVVDKANTFSAKHYFYDPNSDYYADSSDGFSPKVFATQKTLQKLSNNQNGFLTPGMIGSREWAGPNIKDEWVNPYSKKISSRTVESYTNIVAQMKNNVTAWKKIYNSPEGQAALATGAQILASNFTDMNILGDEIHKFIYGGVSSEDMDTDDTAGLRYIKFIDLLSVINYMSGDKYTKQIEYYITHYNNGNMSENFTEICIVPVASTLGNAGTGERFWYTAPSIYAKVFKKNASNFALVSQANQSVNLQLNSRLQYSQNDANEFKSRIGTAQVQDALLRDSASWFTQYVVGNSVFKGSTDKFWRYTCFSCDQSYSSKKSIGTNTGYTFIGAVAKYKEENVEALIASAAGLNRESKPDDKWKMVEPDNAFQFTLQVGLDLSGSPQTISTIKSQWNNYKLLQDAEEPKATVTLTVECSQESSSYGTDFKKGSLLSDSIVTKPKALKSKVSVKDDKVTIKDLTWTELEKLLKGESYIVLTTQDINVNTKTAKADSGSSNSTSTAYKLSNKYTIKGNVKIYGAKASAEMDCNSGGYFNAAPEANISIDLKNSDYFKTAYDKLAAKKQKEISQVIYYARYKFSVAEPAVPLESAYHSVPETPFAEIKEGAPGNESFEAMAGVPTTEKLYLGVGATEVAVSMKAEMASSSGTRTYKLTYNCSQWINNDDKCSYYCSGHSFNVGACGKLTCTQTVHSHSGGCYTTDSETGKNELSCTQQEHSHGGGCYCSSSTPVTLYCDGKGASSGTSTCSCGSKSQGYNAPSPSYTSGSCSGHNDGTQGCQHISIVNHIHPQSRAWTATVTQQIESFKYADITDLEVWNTSQIKLTPDGSDNELYTKNEYVKGIVPSYWAFYDKSNYANGNGRLYFDKTLDAAGKWGNTTQQKTDSSPMKTEECDEAATRWFNTVYGAMGDVTVTVISDYFSAGTSYGYQCALYHEYKSDPAKILTSDFTTGAQNKSMAADPIKFSRSDSLTWDDFWSGNANSAADWEEDHMTRSGYNGQFSLPYAKWNNVDKTSGINNALNWVLTQAHPATKKTSVFPHQIKKGIASDLFMIKDINVREDTLNGEHNTGTVTLAMTQEIKYNSPGGTEWIDEQSWDRASDKIITKEVAYRPFSMKVNNIVIHNPVSTQYATVIANDKRYDLRTAVSLKEGGDPVEADDPGSCPGDASCQYSTLKGTCAGSLHAGDCYESVSTGMLHIGGFNKHVCDSNCRVEVPHVHSAYGGSCYTYVQGHTHTSSCPSHQEIDYAGELQVPYGVYCFVCGTNATSDHKHYNVPIGTRTVYDCGLTSSSSYYILSCSKTTEVIDRCNHVSNTHVCTPECHETYLRVLTCENPHHYETGETWDPGDVINHYEYGDPRCWVACGDSNNHKQVGNVVLPGGAVYAPQDLFINIDREFKIYFPSVGDFAQMPGMLGIADTTVIRGKGYYDGMDVSRWTAHKYLVLPVTVLDVNNTMHIAGATIDLNTIPNSGGYYTFYAVLGNDEACNARVFFNAIASNAYTEEFHVDNDFVTNRDRYTSLYQARHTAAKTQYIDVVGSIGSLTLEDTGDFRYSNLFKQKTGDGSWLITNIVPTVNTGKPNKLLTDTMNVRQDSAAATWYHSVYGVTSSTIGGKNFASILLPLTPAANNIKALGNQLLRPGYKLYMDVETIGNYYGENYDDAGNSVDKNMVYKMQIRPRYWALDLASGSYAPVDAYMSTGRSYERINAFNDIDAKVTEQLYYLDWLNEAARRNYTAAEKSTTSAVKTAYSSPGRVIRIPSASPDPIGNANVLFLSDLNRTFTGSTQTYGEGKNVGEGLPEYVYQRQSQRWHFTTGLPSSVKFVRADAPFTTANMEEFADDERYVIVCTLGIKVKGLVWTLEYNGSYINNTGFKVYGGGRTYSPPTDPLTGSTVKDPIVAVYSSKYTSKDDLRTEGSH